jgi:PHD/YefM family antitoxin component YafN of YafNO toxin-antitoxin module
MGKIERGYVVDENGKQTAVIIAVEEYRRLLDDLEELDSIRAHDAAKASGEKPVPFEEAIGEIESGHR